MEKEGEFVFARSLDSDNTEAIEEFLEQSIRGVCEWETGFKQRVMVNRNVSIHLDTLEEAHFYC